MKVVLALVLLGLAVTLIGAADKREEILEGLLERLVEEKQAEEREEILEGLLERLVLEETRADLDFEELDERVKIDDSVVDRFDVDKISPHSEEEKAAILAKHNEFRSSVSPPATNMEQMEWNEDLATIAGLWSSVCFFGHGLPDTPLLDNFDKRIGQNVWVGARKPEGPNQVNAFHAEYQWYDYDSHKCSKQCGHYTQVVWATSRQVGCGRAFCPVTVDENGNTMAKAKNVWLETCQYYPAGNYAGKRPYIEGPPCGNCASDAKLCNNNMCTDCTDLDNPSATCECKKVCKNCGSVTPDCTCDCVGGWYGSDCSDVCEDWHSKCNQNRRYKPSSCTKNDKIPLKCPVMCGLCTAENECVK